MLHVFIGSFCFLFQEIQRIKKEHPDDPCAVVNDRVKGSLKVTRAFGAGFLKQVGTYCLLIYPNVFNYSYVSLT